MSASSPALTAKLRPPSRSTQYFPRARLAQRLPQARSCRVALVCAPAGSGKTTVLSDWYALTRKSGTAVAWLSLDEFDNVPSRFVSHLLAAFELGCPAGIGDALRGASGRKNAPVDELMARLIQRFEASGVAAVLFLDDYHEITDEAVHGAVDLLIRYAPRSLSIVVGTRQDPPLSLERLRIRGELVEVRWDDLRFTVDETRQYFRDVCRLPLPDEQIRSLCSRSEGWIAALQLTARSVARAPDADRVASAFGGPQAEMAAYLIKDVLGREPPELRRFLLETSILEGMTGALCNAVTGRTDGQEMLETLVAENLFTFALDERRTWFRYHGLFLDVLRARLAVDPAEHVPALHDRASEWLEGCGDLAAAVRHALAGRHFARAARLLEVAGREDFRQGNFKDLRRSIEALPDHIVRRSPTLCVLHAWALGYLGEFPKAWERIASAETALVGSPALPASAPPETIPLRAELDVLRACVSVIEDDEPRVTDLRPDVIAVFPNDERALRAFAAIAVAYAERARGDLEAALAHFEEAVEVSDPTHSSLINSLARFNVGIVTRLMGRGREARRFLVDSLDRASRQLWGRTFGAAILRYALSLILHDEDRAGEALEHLGEAIGILEAGDSFGFIGMALVERARNHAALGDSASAAADMARAREVAESHGVRRVAFHADLLEARLATRAGDLATAADRLETAQRYLAGKPSGAVLSERQEALGVGQVRLRVDQGRASEALRLAGTILRSASAATRRHNMVELLVLQSVAWATLGDGAKGADKLGQALDVVGDEGTLRPFVERGSALVPLLRTLRGRSEHRASAERLLGALSDAQERRPPARRLQAEEHPDDKLHVRESQMLDLIARGLRNREIGDRLFLSEETVKWYVKRLFAKLDVRSRTEAVAVARKRGLLA